MIGQVPTAEFAVNTPIDPAVAFYRQIVEPTVVQFLTQPSDARLGCLACLVLASMADHYFHAREKPVEGHDEVGRFRFALGETHFPYRQILSVANATKHVLPSRGRLGFEQIEPDDIHVGNLRCGWPINGRYVMITVRADEQWPLHRLVALARDMWVEKLGLSAPAVAI